MTHKTFIVKLVNSIQKHLICLMSGTARRTTSTGNASRRRRLGASGCFLSSIDLTSDHLHQVIHNKVNYYTGSHFHRNKLFFILRVSMTKWLCYRHRCKK